MRATQLQRFQARTGVAVFPVPAAIGARGRWVRGMIVAEASDHWVEAFVAEVARRRTADEGAAGARRGATSTTNAEEVVTASLQVRALKPLVHSARAVASTLPLPCFRPFRPLIQAAFRYAMDLLLAPSAALFPTS